MSRCSTIPEHRLTHHPACASLTQTHSPLALSLDYDLDDHGYGGRHGQEFRQDLADGRQSARLAFLEDMNIHLNPWPILPALPAGVPEAPQHGRYLLSLRFGPTAPHIPIIARAPVFDKAQSVIVGTIFYWESFANIASVAHAHHSVDARRRASPTPLPPR